MIKKIYDEKILQTNVLALRSFVFTYLVSMLLIGKKYHFEKSMVINANCETVYSHISSAKSFNQWNPFLDIDKNVKINYSGNQGQIGDKYCWEGNKDAGKGCQEISELIPNKKQSTKITFIEPFPGEATSDIVLTPEGSSTRVTWSMDTEMGYPMNLMKLMMDKEMGKTYGNGLEKLKILSEN